MAVTAFWRGLTAFWRQKVKRKRIFPRAIRTTELPSNPSPLTFRINQIQILQTSSTHATISANVFQQDMNTHGTWLSNARTRQSFFDTTDKKWSEWKTNRNDVITGRFRRKRQGGGVSKTKCFENGKIEEKKNVFFKIILRSQRSGYFSILTIFYVCCMLSQSRGTLASRYVYLRVPSSVQQPSATLSKYTFSSTCSFCLYHLYPTPSRNSMVFIRLVFVFFVALISGGVFFVVLPYPVR